MTVRHRHCPTCTCGVELPVRIDTSAPFWPLVALVDDITSHEQRLRFTASRARRDAADPQEDP